jgi:hypothetical protein
MKPSLEADEVRARLLNDEAFRKRYNQPAAFDYDKRRLEAVVTYLVEAIPLLDELEQRGYIVPQIGALGYHYPRFDDVVPLLLEWAKQLRSGQVWSDILGSVSKPWAREIVGPFLVEIFETTEPQWRTKVAGCIPEVVSPLIESQLIDLIRGPARTDKVWCRERMLAALAKLKTPQSEDVLCEFSSDIEAHVKTTVAKGLAGYKSERALAVLRVLSKDPNKDVARAARTAIARVEKRLLKERQKARSSH